MRKDMLISLFFMVSCAAEQTAETSAAYPAYAAAERLPLEVCAIDGVEEPLLCGALEVYENRTAQTGRKIPIRVVVVPAQEERHTDSAWIDHQGGPRYSMIAQAPYFAKGGFLESFRRNRDIVLIDPRGAARILPALLRRAQISADFRAILSAGESEGVPRGAVAKSGPHAIFNDERR